jgi:hypothetical protein
MDNYNNTRLKLDMSLMDIIMILSEGNPGAVSVLAQIIKEAPKIDPQDAFGGLGCLLALDTHGIFGPRIWMLYKDVCNQDLTSMLAILRADQLGQLAGCSDAAIDHAIDNYGEGLDIPAIVAAVKDRLEDFGKTADSPTEEVPA